MRNLFKLVTDYLGRVADGATFHENVKDNLHHIVAEMNEILGNTLEHQVATDMTAVFEEDDTTAETYDIDLAWTPNPNLKAEDFQILMVREKYDSNEWGDWDDLGTTTTADDNQMAHDASSVTLENYDLDNINGLQFGIVGLIGDVETHIGAIHEIERVVAEDLELTDHELVADDEYTLTFTWTTTTETRPDDVIEILANEIDTSTTEAGVGEVIKTLPYDARTVTFDYDFADLDGAVFRVNVKRQGLNGIMDDEEVELGDLTTTTPA